MRTLLMALLAAVALPVAAGTVALQWDAVEGVTGYRVGYGTASGNYTETHDAGNVTITEVPGLADCTTYFFAVKAYNEAGESASWSNEVDGWSRPYVSGASPESITAPPTGSLTETLTLTGGNFAAGFSAVTDYAGLSIVGVSHIDCSTATVTITVASTIQPGQATIDIINPTSVFGTLDLGIETVIIPIVSGLVRTDLHEDVPPPEPPDGPDEVIVDNNEPDAVSFEGTWTESGAVRWGWPCIYPVDATRPECTIHQGTGATGEWFEWRAALGPGAYDVAVYFCGHDNMDTSNIYYITVGDTTQPIPCAQVDACHFPHSACDWRTIGVVTGGDVSVRVQRGDGTRTQADAVRFTRQ